MQIGAMVIGICTQFLLLYWQVRLLITRCRQKRTINILNQVSLYATIAGTVLRITYFLIIPDTIRNEYTPNGDTIALQASRSILLYLPVPCWLLANCIVAGFWIDILFGSLRKGISRRTRNICFVGAGLSGFAVVGGICNYLFQNAVIGGVLVLFPVLIDTVGLFVVSIMIRRYPDIELQPKNRLKKRYSTNNLTFLCIAWTMYFATQCGFAVVAAKQQFHLFAILTCILRIPEFLIGAFLMRLLDHRSGPRISFLGDTKAIVSTDSTSTRNKNTDTSETLSMPHE